MARNEQTPGNDSWGFFVGKAKEDFEKLAMGLFTLRFLRALIREHPGLTLDIINDVGTRKRFMEEFNLICDYIADGGLNAFP